MAGNNALNAKNTGIQSFDGTSDFNGRTISAGSSKLTVSNGDGVSGNPSIDAVEANFTLNNIGGTLQESKGGTNQTTYATGDILYASASNTLSKLAAGSDGTVLTLASGVPSWAASGSGGKLVQQVRTSRSDYFTYRVQIAFDDTIPQITEGNEVFSLAITPNNANNILVFDYCLTGNYEGQELITALFQDSNADAIYATCMGGGNTATQVQTVQFRFYMTAGTTSSTTFSVRHGTSSFGTDIYVNGDETGRKLGGVIETNFTITEIET